MISQPGIMQQKNHGWLSSEAVVNERPFRSFKMRYLTWFLPAMILVAGFLTIVLIWFAQGGLTQQHRQHLLQRFERHGEYLRMIILAGSNHELLPVLQTAAGQLDLAEIKIADGSGQIVASYSDVALVVTGLEIEIPLIVQGESRKDEQWKIFLKARPNPYAPLIDSFMFYQLIILVVIAIGSITATFLAFDNMVSRPLQSLKNAMWGFLDGREHCLVDFYESDEIGEVCSLFNDLATEAKLDAEKRNDFSRQSGMLGFFYDVSADTFDATGNLPDVPEIDFTVIKTPADLFLRVHPERRGPVKQAWYDLKDKIVANDNGREEIDLKIYNANEDCNGIVDEKWLRMVVFWKSSNGVRDVSGILRDISLIRQRELELKKLADSFRQIYENSPIGIWRCICNNDKYHYMNHSMARILGYSSPEEAMEKVQSISRDVFFNPGERTFFLDEVKKRDQVGNFELRLRRADGSVFWGALFGRLYTDQNIQYCEGGLIDVTERKQLDEQLRSNEEFLRQGLEASGLVLWQLEPVSGRLQLKGAIPYLLGSGIPEMTTLRVFQRLIHPEDLSKFITGIDRLRRGEGVQGSDRSHLEFRICKVDSEQKVEIRWLTVSAVRSEILIGGRQGLVHGVFVDMTNQKESEQRMGNAVEQAKIESRQKSEFFAGVSHEVRTPLNAIIGFSELLAPMIENTKGQHYLSSILSSSRSLINVLNSMLDLSRLETKKVELVLEPVRFCDLIADIRQNFTAEAERRGLEFKTTIDESVPVSLLMDEFRIRQIITSLLSNSFRFTAAGSVQLSVSAPSRQGRQSVDLLISVQDTGQGIHSDDLSDLFKPFNQKNAYHKAPGGGVGLGLAICQQLVELMGGRIKVKSEIQCGSRFDVILRNIQIADLTKQEPVVRSDRQQYRFDGQKILVADDTASNRELIAEAMRSAGLQVICAADGEEAVQLALQEKPELIFMDIRMPRKDGVAAVKELRSIPEIARVPVVAVTASASAREQKNLAELFDGFIYKPVSLIRLFAEAAKYLRNIAKEESVSTAQKALVSPEAFEQLSEPWKLVDSIGNIFVPRLKELDGAIAIENVVKLADSLKTLSVRHSFNSLTIEADRLNSFAEKFDLDGIDNSKKRINQIFSQVLTVYSRQTGA